MTVKCVTLDSLTIEGPIDFIKIDVEGHELSMLAGARETIARHRPWVVIETRPDTAKGVDELLRAVGLVRFDAQMALRLPKPTTDVVYAPVV